MQESQERWGREKGNEIAEEEKTRKYESGGDVQRECMGKGKERKKRKKVKFRYKCTVNLKYDFLHWVSLWSLEHTDPKTTFLTS